MRTIVHVLVLVMVLSVSRAIAQDTTTTNTSEKMAELKDAVDGINESLATMKTTLDALSKIKISGYIQAQFTSAIRAGNSNASRTNDTGAVESAKLPSSGQSAVGNFQGGALGTEVASRFLIRRGRIKLVYDNDLTQAVFQLDMTQGGFATKDAYIMVKEPWLRTFSLTAGIFDRPFGFEISYSSSNREAPERTRMFQTLFPGERELGVKLEVAPNNMDFLNYFNLKVGVFNGSGPTASENDNWKDVIGRLGVSLPFDDLGLAVDAGVSIYSGKVRAATKYVYDTKGTVDSTSTNAGSYFDRNYTGVDVQLYYDAPVIGGLSLRGEYITGTHPGTKDLNTVYAGSGDLYERKFHGYYLAYIQNIGMSNQFVFRYDVFDPNKEINAVSIGNPAAATKNLGLGDLKYTTVGFGWVYHWDANVKFVLYYDKITNDMVYAAAAPKTSSLVPFKADVKDDVFTFRIQYKF